MKRSASITMGVALAAVLAYAALSSSGCAQVQDGIEWAFFPNQKAAAADYEQERAALESEITAERDAADAERRAIETDLIEAQDAERAKLAELDLERVDLGRSFAKLQIDYEADLSQLDIRRGFAVEQSRGALAQIESQIERFNRQRADSEASFVGRMAALDEAYEQRMERAASSDQTLWALGLGGLSFLGGGGIVAAAGLRHLRKKVAEAKQVGASTMWESVEVGMAADPDVAERLRGSERFARAAHSVLNTDAIVLQVANDKRRQRKFAEVEAIPSVGSGT